MTGQHCLQVLNFTEGKTVQIYDGRGTTHMRWPEFLEYASHVATIASGQTISQSDSFVQEYGPDSGISLSDLGLSAPLTLGSSGLKRL